MRRPYHRTLWTWLQLQEHDRIEGIKDRARMLHMAGLLAIAFHEPKKLGDQHHQLMKDIGALPTAEEAIENVADVIAFMAQRDAVAARTAETPDPAPERSHGD